MTNVSARNRRLVVVAVAAIAIAIVSALVVRDSGAQGAKADRASTPQKPIIDNIAALGRGLRIAVTPRPIANLPGDVAPKVGTVRELATGLGRGGLAVYAWPSGARRFCFQTSLGSGGCQTNFFGDASLGVSDPDRVGAGLPAYVWGVVSDSVASVGVVVDGQTRAATLVNNVAFLELADGEHPETIDYFTVRLKNGSVQTIDY